MYVYKYMYISWHACIYACTRTSHLKVIGEALEHSMRNTLGVGGHTYIHTYMYMYICIYIYIYICI